MHHCSGRCSGCCRSGNKRMARYPGYSRRHPEPDRAHAPAIPPRLRRRRRRRRRPRSSSWRRAPPRPSSSSTLSTTRPGMPPSLSSPPSLQRAVTGGSALTPGAAAAARAGSAPRVRADAAFHAGGPPGEGGGEHAGVVAWGRSLPPSLLALQPKPRRLGRRCGAEPVRGDGAGPKGLVRQCPAYQARAPQSRCFGCDCLGTVL